MILAAEAFSGGTPIEAAMVVTLIGVVVAVSRAISKMEHGQETQRESIREIKTCQQQQQTALGSHDTRITVLEKVDERPHRTGRWPVVEGRD